jgi:hypothetical protein
MENRDNIRELFKRTIINSHMVYIKKQIIACILIGWLLAGFPELINDIDGNTINLKELAGQKTIAVITMKSSDCPVCQTQILRIRENFDKLSACNVGLPPKSCTKC